MNFKSISIYIYIVFVQTEASALEKCVSPTHTAAGTSCKAILPPLQTQTDQAAEAAFRGAQIGGHIDINGFFKVCKNIYIYVFFQNPCVHVLLLPPVYYYYYYYYYY